MHAAVAEMEVIEQRVFNPRVGDVGREGLLPDAFGHPHPTDACAEMPFQVFRVQQHLTDAITARDTGENRLVEGAAEELHLAPFHEAAD